MSSRFAVNDDVLRLFAGKRLRHRHGLAGHAPKPVRTHAGMGGAGAHGLCSDVVGLCEHDVQRVKGDASGLILAGRDDGFKYWAGLCAGFQ